MKGKGEKERYTNLNAEKPVLKLYTQKQIKS